MNFKNLFKKKNDEIKDPHLDNVVEKLIYVDNGLSSGYLVPFVLDLSSRTGNYIFGYKCTLEDFKLDVFGDILISLLYVDDLNQGFKYICDVHDEYNIPQYNKPVNAISFIDDANILVKTISIGKTDCITGADIKTINNEDAVDKTHYCEQYFLIINGEVYEFNLDEGKNIWQKNKENKRNPEKVKKQVTKK